ncbi:thioredoxin family protein [Lactobacillus xylocopicola]|uniref:Thiol reductase thioredoxin n=1 Tax=Lactobacillus xylocopicola TaxID=2976676 RepID=A0ABN6SP68_9LACO|nr:thioredoxin family protein [Lactobacillus xylocopicola]BDR60752.1 thiol reductase thioredoxin [Lactobacillus xylocopicola]
MEQIKQLDEAKLTELTGKGRVVLEFSADWCPDCRFLEQFMPAIEQDFADSKFVQVDLDGAVEVAKNHDILGIPSFVVYQDGQEVGRLVNKERKTKDQVEDFLRSID